jgi:hypothetical protein
MAETPQKTKLALAIAAGVCCSSGGRSGCFVLRCVLHPDLSGRRWRGAPEVDAFDFVSLSLGRNTDRPVNLPVDTPP